MNNFYFTRHGMTDANQQKLLCGGEWDIPLNAEGHAQALQAAAVHAKSLANVRTICCSPLLRARQTADAFAKALGVSVVIVEELREQLLGEWERKPWEDVPEFFAGKKDPPQGESLPQFDQRIQRGIQKSLQNDDPVLIVAHGAVWYALHRVLDLTPEPPGSCSVFRFEQHLGSLRRRKLVPLNQEV